MLKKDFFILNLCPTEINGIAVKRGMNGKCRAVGFSSIAKNGFSGHPVSDINSASDNFSKILTKLKQESGIKSDIVYVVLSLPGAQMISSGATLVLSKFVREITSGDISKCLKMGSQINPKDGKESIASYVREYIVDEEPGVTDPLRLEAMKLSVEMRMLLTDISLTNNIAKAMSMSGYILKAVSPEGRSLFKRLLLPKSASSSDNILLINFKQHMTEISLHRRGEMLDYKTIYQGLDDLFKNESLNYDALSNITSEIKSLEYFKHAEKGVLFGNIFSRGELLDPLSDKLNIMLYYPRMKVASLENLPNDHIRYSACLGFLDEINTNLEKNKIKNNIPRRIISSILAFLDEYF